MGFNIGEISIDVAAHTAKLTSGTAQIKASLLGVQTAVDSAAANLSRAFSAVSSAFQATVGQGLQYADQMGKAAQITGVNVEALSGLRHAADLANVGFEELQNGLARFSKHLVATGKGSRDVDAELLKVADRFAAMPDGAGKAALAMERFGKSGARLIPLLNGGAEAIRKATEEARDFGLIVDSKTAAAAEKFNDNLTRLQAIGRGVGNVLAAELAPTLGNVTDELLRAFRGSALLADAGTALNLSMKTLASTGALVAGLFSTLGTSYRQTGAAFLLVTEGEFSAAVEAMRQGATQTADTWAGVAGTGGTIARLWSDTAVVVTENGRKLNKAFGDVGAAAKKAADDGLKPMREALEKMDRLALVMPAHLEALADAVSALQPGVAGPPPELEDPFESFDVLPTLDVLGKRIEAFEKRRLDALEKFRDDLAAVPVSFDPFQIQLGKAADKMGELKLISDDMFHSLSQGFEDAILRGKGFLDVLAAIGQDIARIFLRAGLSDLFQGTNKSSAVLGAIGGFFGRIFGGGRQLGGPVEPGRAYLVGEKGPEWFSPSAAGQIVSRASGVVVNNYIDARGAQGDTEVRVMRAMKAVHDQSVRSAWHAAKETKLRRA